MAQIPAVSEETEELFNLGFKGLISRVSEEHFSAILADVRAGLDGALPPAGLAAAHSALDRVCRTVLTSPTAAGWQRWAAALLASLERLLTTLLAVLDEPREADPELLAPALALEELVERQLAAVQQQRLRLGAEPEPSRELKPAGTGDSANTCADGRTDGDVQVDGRLLDTHGSSSSASPTAAALSDDTSDSISDKITPRDAARCTSTPLFHRGSLQKGFTCSPPSPSSPDPDPDPDLDPDPDQDPDPDLHLVRSALESRLRLFSRGLLLLRPELRRAAPPPLPPARSAAAGWAADWAAVYRLAVQWALESLEDGDQLQAETVLRAVSLQPDRVLHAVLLTAETAPLRRLLADRLLRRRRLGGQQRLALRLLDLAEQSRQRPELPVGGARRLDLDHLLSQPELSLQQLLQMAPPLFSQLTVHLALATDDELTVAAAAHQPAAVWQYLLSAGRLLWLHQWLRADRCSGGAGAALLRQASYSADGRRPPPDWLCQLPPPADAADITQQSDAAIAELVLDELARRGRYSEASLRSPVLLCRRTLRAGLLSGGVRPPSAVRRRALQLLASAADRQPQLLPLLHGWLQLLPPTVAELRQLPAELRRRSGAVARVCALLAAERTLEEAEVAKNVEQAEAEEEAETETGDVEVQTAEAEAADEKLLQSADTASSGSVRTAPSQVLTEDEVPLETTAQSSEVSTEQLSPAGAEDVRTQNDTAATEPDMWESVLSHEDSSSTQGETMFHSALSVDGQATPPPENDSEPCSDTKGAARSDQAEAASEVSNACTSTTSLGTDPVARSEDWDDFTRCPPSADPLSVLLEVDALYLSRRAGEPLSEWLSTHPWYRLGAALAAGRPLAPLAVQLWPQADPGRWPQLRRLLGGTAGVADQPPPAPTLQELLRGRGPARLDTLLHTLRHSRGSAGVGVEPAAGVLEQLVPAVASSGGPVRPPAYLGYLRQARPLFAISHLLHGDGSGGRPDNVSVRRACDTAAELALRGSCAGPGHTAVSAGCVVFQHLLGHDVSLLRAQLAAVDDVPLDLRAELVRGLLLGDSKAAAAVLSHHEDKVMTEILATQSNTEASADDTRWQHRATEFCRWRHALTLAAKHRITFPEKYLSLLASEDDWLSFLMFAQIYQYPRDQVLCLTAGFQSAPLREHLAGALRNLVLSRPASKSARRRVTSETEHEWSTASPDTSVSSSPPAGGVGGAPRVPPPLDGPPQSILSALVEAAADPSPGQALLRAAPLHGVPALAALAAECEDVSAAECACGWLQTSLAAEQPVSAAEPARERLRRLALRAVQERRLPALDRTLEVFFPDCPLRAVVALLDSLLTLQEPQLVAERAAELSDALRPSTQQPDCERFMYDAVWLGETVLAMLLTALTYLLTAAGRARLLSVMIDSGLASLLTTDGPPPDLPLLLRLSALLGPSAVRLDWLTALPPDGGPEKLRLECSRVVAALCDRRELERAEKLALAAGVSPDQVVLTQVADDLREVADEDRVQFWRQCDGRFSEKQLTPAEAVAFFRRHAEDAQTATERYICLRLAWQWLGAERRNNPDCDVTALERGIWTAYTWARVRGEAPEEPSAAADAEPLLFRRPLPAGGRSAGPRPSSAQLPAVRRVVDQLLDAGRLRQALLVADCFSTSTPDLDRMGRLLQLAERLGRRRRSVSPAERPTGPTDQPPPAAGSVGRPAESVSRSSLGDRRASSDSADRAALSDAGGDGARAVPAAPGPARTPSTCSSLGWSWAHGFLSSTPAADSGGGSAARRGGTAELPELVQLAAELKHGTSAAQRVLSCARAARDLEMTYQDVVLVSEPLLLLGSVLQRGGCGGADQCRLAADLIHGLSLPDSQVTEVILAETISQVKAGGAQVGPLIALCPDPVLLGNRLLDTAEDLASFPESDGYGDDCQVGLLVAAHSAHTARLNLQGISDVMGRARRLVRHLLVKEDFRLMVQLLLGLGRYEEMSYVFELLLREDRLERLLTAGVSDARLGTALRRHLIQHHPSDTARLRLVTGRFGHHAEAAADWRQRADQLVLALVRGGAGGRDEPAVGQLREAMDCYRHAATFYRHADRLAAAEASLAQAQLVALQISISSGTLSLPEDERPLLLRRTPDQLHHLLNNVLTYPAARLVLRAYPDQPVDWSLLLYRQYLCLGRDRYLADYLAAERSLDRSVTAGLLKRVRASGRRFSPARLRQVALSAGSLERQYGAASQLQLRDVISELLERPEAGWLKDTVWKTGGM